MDAHQAAMTAIRKGQFRLRTPLQSEDRSQSSKVRFTSMVQICAMLRPNIPSEFAANAICMKDSILVAFGVGKCWRCNRQSGGSGWCTQEPAASAQC